MDARQAETTGIHAHDHPFPSALSAPLRFKIPRVLRGYSHHLPTMFERWRQARIGRYQSRIDNLADDGQWSRALTAVIDFAQWADGRIDDPEVWLEMTVDATRIVGHLDDPAEYRAFLTHFAEPFLGDDDRPRPGLLPAFESIADHAEPAVVISIGRWLTDARTDWPLGPYLMAHFGEIDLDGDDPQLTVESIADHFALATRRASRIGDDDWELHTRLRHGAVLMTTGADRGRGHEMLGTLDWSKLSPDDQLWMAVALAHSVRWTDRVRAMDILLDLHDRLTSARDHDRQLQIRDLRRAASAIFKFAGLDLPEAEERRLQQLSTTLFRGDERQAWTDFLSSRRQLSKVSNLPFDQSGEVAPLLDKLEAVHPDRWQPANRRFKILQAGWDGDYRSTDAVPSPGRRDRRLPIADTVGRILDAAEARRESTDAAGDDLDELLEQLVDELTQLTPDGDGSAARPVALVWPKLLAVASSLNLEAGGALLADLADAHTAVAPPPGYGWWTLAAHLYDAGLDDAAATVAETALADGSDGADDELRGWVASRTFQRAVDRTDAHNARRWLDELPGN